MSRMVISMKIAPAVGSVLIRGAHIYQWVVAHILLFFLIYCTFATKLENPPLLNKRGDMLFSLFLHVYVAYMCLWILTWVHTCVWVYMHVCSRFLFIYRDRVSCWTRNLTIWLVFWPAHLRTPGAHVSAYWVLRLYEGAHIYLPCPTLMWVLEICTLAFKHVWQEIYPQTCMARSFPTQSHSSAAHKVSLELKTDSTGLGKSSLTPVTF